MIQLPLVHQHGPLVVHATGLGRHRVGRVGTPLQGWPTRPMPRHAITMQGIYIPIPNCALVHRGHHEHLPWHLGPPRKILHSKVANPTARNERTGVCDGEYEGPWNVLGYNRYASTMGGGGKPINPCRCQKGEGTRIPLIWCVLCW